MNEEFIEFNGDSGYIMHDVCAEYNDDKSVLFVYKGEKIVAMYKIEGGGLI